MAGTETFLLNYLLNAIWQVPVIAGAARLATLHMHRLGTEAIHHVWVGALLLSVVVPAWSPTAAWHLRMPWAAIGGSSGADARVEILTGAMHGGGTLPLTTRQGRFLLLAYAAVLLYRVARLLWGLWRGRELRRNMLALQLNPEQALSWRRCCVHFEVSAAVLATSQEVDGPVMLGLRKPVLLLPPGFLERAGRAERDAALAHECAHMARRDYAKNLLYELLSLRLAFHPVAALLRSQLAGSRELLCDELAAEAVGSGRRYAHSLLRLAAAMAVPPAAQTIHAIGMFDANLLERRIMNLMTRRERITRWSRLGAWTVCGLLGVGACGSALALRLKAAPAAETAATAASPSAKNSTGFTSPQLVTQVNPQYPAQARAEHKTVNGSVLLGVVIGEDGKPVNLHLVKSLRADYDASAMEAVKQWRWSPATNAGKPTEVDVTITVTFSLQP